MLYDHKNAAQRILTRTLLYSGAWVIRTKKNKQKFVRITHTLELMGSI